MKNTVKLFGFIALTVVIGFSLIACGEIEEISSRQFTVTIRNASSYSINAYMVETHAGLASSDYSFGYSSVGFDDPINYYHWSFDEDTTVKNMPEINIATGETSNALGPFKVTFRSDRANPSSIVVAINYNDGTLNVARWNDAPSSVVGSNGGTYSGYWEDDVPSNFNLVFNGTSLIKE